MRLLVVEDDPKIASFVVRGLKEAGFSADHAPDGETGLALAQTTEYDAAIVDVMLPRLDEILTFLDGFAPDQVPADVNRLFLLTLSLAEVAPAIENFNQPSVIDGYDFKRFVPVHD